MAPRPRATAVLAWYARSLLAAAPRLFFFFFFRDVGAPLIDVSFFPHRGLCRGSGEDGQLGMGDSEEKDWSHPVDALEPYAVTAVVAGSRNSLAICQDGRVRPRPSFLAFPEQAQAF